MSFLSLALVFVMTLGVLVFVHELGHFLVAKLFDVKVLKFSLGFGPTIGFGRFKLAFQRGETEYVVAWFPLGGFVKMLGENPDEERLATEAGATCEAHPGPDPTPIDPADIPRAFHNKPVWQRLLVLFAGPAMNLLLPVALFALALWVGMPRPEPIVGNVEPLSPAARAGVEVGDRVLAVAGEPVQWWGDVEDALRASAAQDVALRVRRGDGELDLVLAIASRAGTDLAGVPAEVGFAGIEHSRLAAIVGIPDAQAPAAASELRSGDRVLEVAGQPVADWVELAARYAEATPGRVSLLVERGGEGESEAAKVAVDVPALGNPGALGIVPATVLIAAVTPDSPAAAAGLLPGDLVLAVDGDPIGSFASFSEIVRGSKGRALAVTYARAGERHEVSIRAKLAEADTGLGIPEERWLIGVQPQLASLPGAYGRDRETNPLVAIPRGFQMTAELTRDFLGGLKRLVSGEISRKQLAGPIGIAEIAHNAFERGWFDYLGTLVLISINLGVLNLLPIPVLDGGQALLIAIEGIKRSPLSLRTREIVQQVGLTMLVMLMGYAFWNDLSRKWASFVEWVRQSAGL